MAKNTPPREAPLSLAHQPFAAIAGRLGGLPAGPQPVSDPRVGNLALPASAVVRLERKGHGGKEVTVIERLELDEASLAQWLVDLKSSLGCGGVAKGGVLQLQGDQRQRARAWLEARGVRRVSVSG